MARPFLVASVDVQGSILVMMMHAADISPADNPGAEIRWD